MPAQRTVKKHKKASTRKVESSLEKAQTLFVLCNPEPATEQQNAAGQPTLQTVLVQATFVEVQQAKSFLTTRKIRLSVSKKP